MDYPILNNGANLIFADDFGNEFLQYAGKRIPILMRIPFTYQVPVISNTAVGATAAPAQILIDSGSDFLWQSGVYEFDLAAAAYTYTTRPVPNMTLVINDSAAGRNLQNTAVPIGARFGAVEKPVMLPLPYLFGAAATVTFTATNFDAAVTTGNLRLSLIGQQIYYK